MKQATVLVIAWLAPMLASASTKFIECAITTDSGLAQVLKATIADESEKAEVQFYATNAECMANNSCGVEIYRKEVLPTIIRLTRVLQAPGATYTTEFDIDRSSLQLTTDTNLVTSVGNSETHATGTCKVRVDETKKLL